MSVKRFYCGLMLVQAKGIYAVIDSYKMDIKCKGTFEECNKYFDSYIEKICERD